MPEGTVLTPAECRALKEEILSSLHCALPGTVVSFDPETQTAEVQPALKAGSLTFPALADVPVFFPGSRESAVTWPVSAGDECLLILADADIDAWFDSGEASVPRSARKHSLSDAFAFVGFRSRPNALRDFPDQARFFNGSMAPHNHDDRYYTESETDTKLAGKADSGHTHDDRYYTESETDTKLAGKANSSHTHDDRYFTESEITTKLSGKKNTQTPVPDPLADGTGVTFIDRLSQDAQGIISPHKQSVRVATSSLSGLMPAADKAKSDGMGMIAYGTCDTAAGTAAKAVTLSNSNWQLKVGSVIGVKFAYSNTFSATADSHVSLNVNNTGAKDIYYNASSAPTGTSTTAFGYKNRVNYYMYDGTYWVWMGMSAELNDNTIPSAYCSTAAATASKAASCSGYALLSKSYIQVILTASNTAASALTLNINSKGAKPIYINGAASDASNYTLPAGSYLVYYDGTNYQFRTDGVIPGATVPVSRGGTGQTATGATTTISSIATAAADCEITSASYAYWGKVAMVRLVVKKTTAVASGTTTLCTLAAGKRPKYTAPAQWAWNNGAQITTGGAVQVNGAISAGASVTILSTYILP